MKTRRLLIVSPHFPPTDTVDMHRVRMNVATYAAAGWRPHVLAVKPDAAERPRDDRLLTTALSELPTKRVSAFSARSTRFLGLSALGVRAFGALRRAGDALLSEARQARDPFDLVFFSTTAFPVMALGPRWRRRFATPFVLDFQDPWFTAPRSAEPWIRRGLKHGAMRALHRRLERATVPQASGFIAVSERYINALSAAYPRIASAPAATIPFGFSAADLETARLVGRCWNAVGRAQDDGGLAALSAGRAGDDLARAAETLFSLALQAESQSLLARIRWLFLGTGYATAENPARIAPIAATLGLTGRVFERPDRLPLFDALASLSKADILLVLGSDDLAYQPSKLHQYLAMNKPVLVVAPRESRLAAQVRDTPGVVLLHSDDPITADRVVALNDALADAVATSAQAVALRKETLSGHAAENRAKEEIALFEAALAYASTQAAEHALASNRALERAR